MPRTSARGRDVEEGPRGSSYGSNARRLEKHTFPEDDLIPALAWRRYHLPGYDYCEDLLQYLCNNHPLFGLCCHHRHHPIHWRMRVVMLLGSIVCGLLITNAVWLYYVFDEDADIDEPFISIDFNNNTGIDPVDGGTTNNRTTSDTITVTNGMIMLWTAGAALHALFDNLMWYATACVCCLPATNEEEKPSRCQSCGSYSAMLLVAIATAAATLIVLLRASYEDDDTATIDGANVTATTSDWKEFNLQNDKSAYRFLAAYAAELILALLVYYPAVALLFFSGILGCCGAIPVMGGRPYEVRMEWQRWERAERRSTAMSPTDSYGSRRRR